MVDWDLPGDQGIKVKHQTPLKYQVPAVFWLCTTFGDLPRQQIEPEFSAISISFPYHFHIILETMNWIRMNGWMDDELDPRDGSEGWIRGMHVFFVVFSIWQLGNAWQCLAVHARPLRAAAPRTSWGSLRIHGAVLGESTLSKRSKRRRRNAGFAKAKRFSQAASMEAPAVLKSLSFSIFQMLKVEDGWRLLKTVEDWTCLKWIYDWRWDMLTIEAIPCAGGCP